MRKLQYIFIRLVFNALFALVLLKCFTLGAQYGVQLIGLNNWLIQLFCGISTALLFNAVLSLAQKTILLYLKHLQIASICVPDKNPNVVVFSRIGTVSVIVILNKILRGLAKEIVESIKNGSCGSIELFAEISRSTLAKGGKYIIGKCFDYLDECVLSYCYTHPNDSLGSAAENAVVIFLENSATLLIKTTTVCLTSAFIKAVIAIVETLLLLKVLPFSFINLITIYLIVHVSGFVIADSLVEPLMLDNIVKEFCNLSIKDENNIGVLESVASIAQQFKSML